METNGAVARAIDGKLGWRVTSSNIGGRLLAKIQEAIDFVGVDQAGHKLDFHSGDIVALGACDFVENVVLRAAHSTAGALSRISVVGAGRDSTKVTGQAALTPAFQVESGGTEGAPNSITDLTAQLKGDDAPAIRAETPLSVARVKVANAGTGMRLSFYGKVVDSEFNGLETGITANGKLELKTLRFTTVRIGIDAEREQAADTVTASGIRFTGTEAGIPGPALDLSFYEAGVKVEDVTRPAGSLWVRHSKNSTVANVTLRQLNIDQSNRVDATNPILSGETSSSALFVANSENISVIGGGKGAITGNRIGARIIGSKVTLIGLTIANNSVAGISKNAATQLTLRANVLKGNGKGVSDNIVTNKTESAFTPHPGGTTGTDVWEDNAFVGNSGVAAEIALDGNVDLGGGSGAGKGGNIFLGNGSFDVANGTSSRLSAKNNIWSSSDPAEILRRYVSAGSGGVDVQPVMPLQTAYFAQFVEAPSFTSTLTLVDPSRSNNAAAIVAFRNGAGNGVSLSLNESASPGGLQPAAVAALGASSFSTSPATTSANVGSITVASGRPLSGTVLFSSAAGVAGVGASVPLTQFIAPVERSLSRSTNAGIAVTNPSTTAPVTVQLRLRETASGAVQNGTLDVPAGGQTAKFIHELFNNVAADFTGTLIASAPASIAATVIRTAPGQFATLPVTGGGSRSLLFAQFGEAAGLTSTLTFVNPSADRTANVTARLFDDNGSPLTVNLGGADRAGQFTFSVAPQSSASFSSPGTSSTARVGSVVVDSTENIGGTVLFGGAFGLAGVGASQSLSNFVAPVEQNADSGVTIGLALMNAGTAQTVVKLTLRDEGGTPIPGGTTDVTLPGRGHTAKFLSQFFTALDLANFRGTITGETSGQIGATVIRQSAAPLEFATLPVAEIVP